MLLQSSPTFCQEIGTQVQTRMATVPVRLVLDDVHFKMGLVKIWDMAVGPKLSLKSGTVDRLSEENDHYFDTSRDSS